MPVIWGQVIYVTSPLEAYIIRELLISNIHAIIRNETHLLNPVVICYCHVSVPNYLFAFFFTLCDVTHVVTILDHHCVR